VVLTTKEAGERLGISASRVRQLVLNKRLPAMKAGRDLLIRDEDLELVSDRKPGRPTPYAHNAGPNLVVAEEQEQQADYRDNDKEPDLLKSAKKVYKMLVKYDKVLRRTPQHKSAHSMVHSKIAPVLQLLRQAIQKDGK
jgi:excisionase family DNA binding protein